MVLTSDKGNATVLMMREQYLNLSQQLVDDSKYYQPLLRNPTSTYTNKINKYITDLKNKNIIDEKLAKSLHNYNGYAPRFYCLPKIHKPQLSMRPILSSINAPNTNIAQFLTDILSKAYNYKNDINIIDSFQFSDFINNYQLPSEYVLVSFDVVSLFSNLPYSSVVTSLRNHWNEIQPHSPVSWETFSELLKLTFDTNYLIFNDKYYRQIFGTPMGSSISPILVNFVLDDLINDSISKLDFQVPFVKRYVDDLILATPPDKIQSTLSVFNSIDTHLQFTCELEVENSIPFLDMRIIRTRDNTLGTTWYRKEMASNRFLNYHSAHPMRYKHNLVQALSLRVHTLTHTQYKDESLGLLKSILIDNSYPIPIINKYLFSKSYGRSISEAPNGEILASISNSIQSNHPPITSERAIKYASLPYFPQVTNKLTKLFKNLPVKIALKNAKTVGKLFSKSKTPLSTIEHTNVVYNIPCAECHSSYIGQTSRSLLGRLTSHKSDIRMSKPSCALAQHAISTKHHIDFTKVKILAKHQNHQRRTFIEMCEILKNPSALNKRTDIDNLSQVYHSLIIHNK
ncbi:uncharacterized protein LOC126892549 [Diabrotica virgifera virgifera]|uniref:Reverse transcriptase domain-containing protein n=1 Tax=Diabrotica virgifera virgifera TaxID=50390 RepID=A0ABM5L6K2_DIAVI|nr:uncharacterized protein LOC126892549 [Diabrotica virgifera virgifera]